MDLLHPVPEIGVCKSYFVRFTLVSDDTCDICMTRKASIYCSCNMHKMCCSCCCRWASMRCCPLCRPLRIRSLEKRTGRPYITPSTYMPLTRYEGSSGILPIITDDVNSDLEQDEDLLSKESDSVWGTSSLSDCGNITICFNASDPLLSDASQLLSGETLNSSHEDPFHVPQEYAIISNSFASSINWDPDSHAVLVKSPIYTCNIPLGV